MKTIILATSLFGAIAIAGAAIADDPQPVGPGQGKGHGGPQAQSFHSAALQSSAGPNYTFADGSTGYRFTTAGGLTNPGVIVGFNPQPDPPGFVGDQLLSTGLTTSISTPANAGGYSFDMAFLGLGTRALPLPGAPSTDGITTESFQIGSSVFDVVMTFQGPGSAINWAAFNPQPDPPGVWFGAQFGYPVVTDPTASFRVYENGAPLSLSLAVPEPTPWVLLIVGVGAVGAQARRRRMTADGEGPHPRSA